MKFSIKDFFSKYDQIRTKMERFVIIVNGWKPLTIITKRSILVRVWSHLLKKSLMENFIFCVVLEAHWTHCRNRLVTSDLYDIYFSV